MALITLEDLRTKHAELAELIAKFSSQTSATRLPSIPETEVELKPGERYAGTVLDEDGTLRHHLILLPAAPDSRLNWADAKAWAAEVGGELPTRQEQALLFANCKSAFEEAWHWSCEEHEEDASYAWSCFFLNGFQSDFHKSYEGRARAVRRFAPSVL